MTLLEPYSKVTELNWWCFSDAAVDVEEVIAKVKRAEVSKSLLLTDTPAPRHLS